MDHEQRRTRGALPRWWNQHEALKNHLTSVALLLAGAWAVYQFQSLQLSSRAEAELALLKREPVARIEVSAAPTALPGERICAVAVSVDVENTGALPVSINLGRIRPLRIVTLGVDPEGVLRATGGHGQMDVLGIASDTSALVTVKKIRLAPGEQTLLQFLIPRVPAGTFLLQFSAPIESGSGSATGWHWTGRRIYVHSATPTESRQRSKAGCTVLRRRMN